MKCTNCNADIEAGARFCSACGTPVTEEIATEVSAEAVTEAPAETATEAAATTSAPEAKKGFFAKMIAVCKGLIGKADDAAGKIFGKKKTYAYAGALGVVALILVIVAIAGLIPDGNGYLTFEYSVPMPYDGTLYLMKDGKLPKVKIDAESFANIKTSIDNEVHVLISDELELFVLKGKKAKKVAEEGGAFWISLYGDAIVYKDADDAYNYCKTSSGKSVTLYDDDGEIGSFTISPDGKSVAYTVIEDGEADLYYFNGKKSQKVGECDGRVLGMSNGGKYIYTLETGEKGTALYVFNKKGDKNKIDSCSTSFFAFNIDATEVMFYDDGRTYISVKGKEPQRVASKTLSLLTPRYTKSFELEGSSAIYPVDSLYNHVYTGDGSVYYVSKNENKNTKIINGASSFTLDDSGKYVYFKDDGELRCAKISHGSEAESKSKLIAEDAEEYVVSSDRKYVYYVSEESLYVVNGKKGGREKMISNDDISNDIYSDAIAISNKDVVYYKCDGDVYAAKGRSKGKKVLDDAEFMNLGGYVYIGNDETLYAARGTSKPKKLLDIE